MCSSPKSHSWCTRGCKEFRFAEAAAIATLPVQCKGGKCMVKFGDRNNPDDAPTSMNVRKVAQKYNGHKLARNVGHVYVERRHGGESTKANKHVSNPSGEPDRFL